MLLKNWVRKKVRITFTVDRDRIRSVPSAAISPASSLIESSWLKKKQFWMRSTRMKVSPFQSQIIGKHLVPYWKQRKSNIFYFIYTDFSLNTVPWTFIPWALLWNIKIQGKSDNLLQKPGISSPTTWRPFQDHFYIIAPEPQLLTAWIFKFLE